MALQNLPTFRYHPDPLRSGLIKQSNEVCIVCNARRGYIYVGPVYCVEEVVDEVCPWCIADGSAAAVLDAQFTDVLNVPPDVRQTVLGEILTRTPGFAGWQQEHWMFHCGDGAAFLGLVGFAEIHDDPDAVAALGEDTGLSGDALDQFVAALSKDGSPTAYLFECLNCQVSIAYSDCDKDVSRAKGNI